jgi:hypothetical protein
MEILGPAGEQIWLWQIESNSKAFPCALSTDGGVPLGVMGTARTAVKAVLAWFLIA